MVLLYLKICWLWSILLLLTGALRAEDRGPVGLFEAGRFEEARAAFVARLADHPDDPEALYYLGRLTPEGAKSQGYFERLLKTHPNHDLADDALFELAEAVYAGPSGRYIHARSLYRRLLVSYPESPLAPRALYRIGTTFLVTRQPDSAAVAFHPILDRFPGSEMVPYARLGMVEAEAQKGRTAEALRAAEALQAADPGPLRAEVQRQIASLKAALGRADGGEGETRRPEVYRLWVRVGAFRKADNLRALSARLNRAGFRTKEERTEPDGLCLLFAGPYPDEAAADSARRRIEASEGLKCQVVKRP